MRDERWLEVEADTRAAVRHFANGVRLYVEDDFEGDGFAAYRASMALMHAIQAGHTSLESMLVRILDLLGEQRPTGERWHGDLIRRASISIDGDRARPAVLPPPLAAAADETRRFRNLAVHGYDGFLPHRAAPAIEAARLLADELMQALDAFRARIDPSQANP